MALSAISVLMTQIYSVSSDLSPELQTHIVNCFLLISACMPNRHPPKLTCPRGALLVPLPNLLLHG